MKGTLSRYNNNSISTKVNKTKLTTAGAISGAGSVRMEIYYGENWVRKKQPISIINIKGAFYQSNVSFKFISFFTRVHVSNTNLTV